MFKPNEDRVLILPIPNPDKSKGGLYIPDNARGTPTHGKVIAVGPGKACPHCGLPHPIVGIEAGQLVVFPGSAGTDIEIDEVEYRIIRGTDIQAYEPVDNG